MARRSIPKLRTIVTGASSGIGREMVKQLVQQGARVVAVARREDRLQALADELNAGDSLVTLVGDVTVPAVRTQALEICQSRFGGLDAIVNNAGQGGVGPFADSNSQRLRDIMELNFFAAVEFCREALPLLRKGRRPIIVNVSSVVGHRGIRGMSEYCASKFALHGFSDSLRAELAAERIDVLLVSPCTTASEFFERAAGERSLIPQRFGAMSSAAVAKKSIRAMRAGRHEIILTPGGKLLVWLDRLSPPIMNRLIAWFS